MPRHAEQGGWQLERQWMEGQSRLVGDLQRHPARHDANQVCDERCLPDSRVGRHRQHDLACPA